MSREKPLAWKHYTDPLERRLEHLLTKKHQNSFDKHEASALKHVLEVVKQPAQKPWVGLTDDEIDYQAKKDDHGVYFALGALWAEAKLKEKNNAD
jgi:hypothetical protein